MKARTEATQRQFEVQIRLNLAPDAVRVQLCAEDGMVNAHMRQEMRLTGQLADASSAYVYIATAPATDNMTKFKTCVIPHHDGVAIPMGNARILRQR
jgi:glycogen phosphorylase